MKYTNYCGTHYVGRIQLNTRTRVCDPCYDNFKGDVPRIARVLPTMPGVYECFVTTKKNLIGDIIAINQDLCPPEIQAIDVLGDLQWNYECSIGNDSGQMGIYSDAYFSRHAKTKEWYDGVCKITLDPEAGTTNGKGVVSSTGYGDGCYPISVIEQDGKVMGIKVTFID